MRVRRDAPAADAAVRHVELTDEVRSVDAVEAVAVQVDEAGGSLVRLHRGRVNRP